jgi:hypothetical protein
VIRRAVQAALATALLAAVLVPTAPASASAGAAAAYVDSTYGLFLGRAPTADERARWTPTIELGHRGALTRALAASNEWAGSRVDQLYVSVLGRRADASGRAHWVRHIAAGHTLESVAALLYGSAEYWQSSGATAGGFVDRVYAGILGRAADRPGHAHWVGVLDGGTPAASVAAGFYGSVESRTTRVAGLFRDVLGREPDDAGAAYWIEQVPRLGDVALAATLAASDERWVAATGTDPPATPSRGWGTGFQPFATAGVVTLHHPVAAAEVVGFHESGHDGSVQQHVRPTGVPTMTLPSRHRGNASRSAADVVVPPGTQVRAPVSGVVRSAKAYVLYCRYTDHEIVIEPDARPGWLVVVLHVDGVSVRPGDRVTAGITPIAPKARQLPFASQVDRYTARPAWPHVHVEVFDPSVPDRPAPPC